MREHQIVISLKPEHFQQVQRMARADGSKSVSVFVRQRLLASLGLDGQEQAAEAATAPDWQHIAGQLRRLHRELQVFIAESITANQLAETAEPPMFIEPEENFITRGGPILVEYNPAHQLYVEQKQALGQSTQSPPPQTAPATKPPVFDSSTDEMEQLADRAFAISPRLGAIESAPAPANRYDPLQDLLEEKLVKKVAEQEQDDEEADEEPEPEDETFEDEDSQSVAKVPPAEAQIAQDPDNSTVYANDDDESSGTTSGAAASEAQSDDEQSDYGDDDEEMQQETHINDANDEEGPADETAPPPAPPPISGGPPPRKRAR